MKKIILFALTAVLLISCLSSGVFANEEIFTIKLNGFNGHISGGDAYIYTSVENWANNNPNWAYSLHLVPVAGAEEGYYTAVKTVNCTGNDGNSDATSILAANYFPDFDADNGDLLITFHSNGGDDPNSKAWGISAEQIVHLIGIDLEALTVSADASLEFFYGMEAPTAPDNGESSAPADDSSAVSDNSSVTSDETSAVSDDSSAVVEDSSAPAEDSSVVVEDSSVPATSSADTTSEADEDSNATLWIIIGIVAAVVIIAVIVVVIKKKK